MNGCKLDLWTEPMEREFGGEKFREKEEPDMPDVDVVWRDIGREDWEVDAGKEEVWTVRQGTGADCSVAAGLGVSLEHDRLWDSKVDPSACGTTETDRDVAWLKLVISPRTISTTPIRKRQTCSQAPAQRGMARSYHRRSPTILEIHLETTPRDHPAHLIPSLYTNRPTLDPTSYQSILQGSWRIYGTRK